MVTDLRIDIVTFNANEADAVARFMAELAVSPSAWEWVDPAPDRTQALRCKRPNVALNHIALLAQGNVIAATQLARAFVAKDKRPDFIVFYGCAGAINPSYRGEAFLVGSASYASLGTVERSGTSEKVTLKNKWMCHAKNSGTSPLQAVDFEPALRKGARDLAAATSLTTAHVVATDKVVKVGAAAIAPAPLPGAPIQYAKADWSYGEALAYVAQHYSHCPVLVEMEAFGIGQIAMALDILDQVVIARVVTDDLVNHPSSDAYQRQMLMEWRVALAQLVLTMITV